MKKIKNNSGFTLMELMVVIAVIVILAAMLMPALITARKQAVRAECVSNLKQLGIAFQCYALDNNGVFPPSDTWANALIGGANPYLAADPGGDRSTIVNCPGVATATPYIYSITSGTTAENAGPNTPLLTCPSGAHPGTINRLYGDGHVGPFVAP